MPAKASAQKVSKPKKGISVNIDAFEIIPRGSTIIIESSVPIDERALASGLRFDKTRAKAAITDRGTHVVISVDDSFTSGRNTLYLSDLYTPEPESKRIDVDLEIPFFVVDSKVAFPREVKVETYSRVSVVGDL